jgi:hypothetical protein
LCGNVAEWRALAPRRPGEGSSKPPSRAGGALASIIQSISLFFMQKCHQTPIRELISFVVTDDCCISVADAALPAMNFISHGAQPKGSAQHDE